MPITLRTANRPALTALLGTLLTLLLAACSTSLPPTLPPTQAPTTSAGTITHPDGTTVAVRPPTKLNAPPTLDELKRQNPELGPYIDSIKDKPWHGIDLRQLYEQTIAVYRKHGMSGAATFLTDSGVLQKLNIPLSYTDLLLAYGDEGDWKAVEQMARSRKLISDKDEIIGYLAIDSPQNVDAVKRSLAADLGLSVYGYDANTGEVEIGIPLSVLQQLQTPGKLIEYFAKIGNAPHIVGFRPPVPHVTRALRLGAGGKGQ